MYEFCTDYSRMFMNIVDSAAAYVYDSKRKSLVIGMSGGIDSALTAALATEVAKQLGGSVDVIGLSINIDSKADEIKRGSNAIYSFCDAGEIIDLSNTYHLIAKEIVGDHDLTNFDDRVRLGNIKARLRMIKLYDLARKNNGMVLSTDNYTELLLGFWTLHGDVGDFGMLQNLWKTEVYGLAAYMAELFKDREEYGQADVMRETINAIPTDGLGVTESDFDQLYPEASKMGSPVDVYHQIDTLLYNGVVCKKSDENQVVCRHRDTKFKRENPFNIPREHIVD